MEQIIAGEPSVWHSPFKTFTVFAVTYPYFRTHMSRFLFLICFIALVIPAQAQDEEERLTFSGKVYQQDSLQPLASAYIIIKKSEGGTVTDGQGRFTLYVKPSDTILVTYTGFEPQTIPISNLTAFQKGSELYLRIYMKPLIVKLRSAVVVAIRPVEAKKTDQAFFEGQIKRYTVKPTLSMNGGLALEGGLSALLMPFTRKGKEMIKFEQMYLRMETERVVNKRFNDDLVHDLTGMDYADIPAFKKFCGFSNEFVLASNDYDFYLAIRKAYDRYLFSRFGIREQNK